MLELVLAVEVQILEPKNHIDKHSDHLGSCVLTLVCREVGWRVPFSQLENYFGQIQKAET